ncbi:MAG: hypothetical protein RML49_01225 [Verrucomicrobiae bacterium]|nr:hypothetical protein [Verrucomicrobiae bacterium]
MNMRETNDLEYLQKQIMSVPNNNYVKPWRLFPKAHPASKIGKTFVPPCVNLQKIVGIDLSS